MKRYYIYYRNEIIQCKDEDELEFIMMEARDDLANKYLAPDEYEMLQKVKQRMSEI